MQTITTKYHGPTDTRGSRIKATASGSKLFMYYGIDNSKSIEENHRDAAQALADGHGWKGRMIGGDTKAGKVWVFAAEAEYPHNVING